MELAAAQRGRRSTAEVLRAARRLLVPARRRRRACSDALGLCTVEAYFPSPVAHQGAAARRRCALQPAEQRLLAGAPHERLGVQPLRAARPRRRSARAARARARRSVQADRVEGDGAHRQADGARARSRDHGDALAARRHRRHHARGAARRGAARSRRRRRRRLRARRARRRRSRRRSSPSTDASSARPSPTTGRSTACASSSG